MRESDLKAFTETLDAACTLLSRGAYKPNGTSTAIFFRALQAHDLRTVLAAFDAHVRDPQRGRYVPTPADIIAQIEGTAAEDGRPGAEEAWAIALRSRDEADTVVWTAEIAQAVGIARPLLDIRDEVGARMAFKEAYNRLVDEARAARAPVGWSTSLGYDPKRRDEAIRAGVDAGRLPLAMLPAPAGPDMPLLALADAPGAPPQIKERLAELREHFVRKADEPSIDAKERAATEARRAAEKQKVEQYANEHGIDLQRAPAPSSPQQGEEVSA